MDCRTEGRSQRLLLDPYHVGLFTIYRNPHRPGLRPGSPFVCLGIALQTHARDAPLRSATPGLLALAAGRHHVGLVAVGAGETPALRPRAPLKHGYSLCSETG